MTEKIGDHGEFILPVIPAKAGSHGEFVLLVIPMETKIGEHGEFTFTRHSRESGNLGILNFGSY